MADAVHARAPAASRRADAPAPRAPERPGAAARAFGDSLRRASAKLPDEATATATATAPAPAPGVAVRPPPVRTLPERPAFGRSPAHGAEVPRGAGPAPGAMPESMPRSPERAGSVAAAPEGVAAEPVDASASRSGEAGVAPSRLGEPLAGEAVVDGSPVDGAPADGPGAGDPPAAAAGGDRAVSSRVAPAAVRDAPAGLAVDEERRVDAATVPAGATGPDAAREPFEIGAAVASGDAAGAARAEAVAAAGAAAELARRLHDLASARGGPDLWRLELPAADGAGPTHLVLERRDDGGWSVGPDRDAGLDGGRDDGGRDGAGRDPGAGAASASLETLSPSVLAGLCRELERRLASGADAPARA